MRDVMLILHFIGLTMGIGTGFAHAFLGAAAAKMSPEEATRFRLHTLVLSRMGHTGLGLLLVSGLYLITPYWSTLPSNPWLIVKLALVITLLTVITLISIAARKAQKGDAEAQFKKIQTLGKISLLVGLSIVMVAVSVFH